MILSLIKKPIENDLNDFIELFNRNLSHDDGLLSSALTHIRQRGGKRMRPMLILLTAKNYGAISDVTQHAAVGLELLHTASLVHDDVVDESEERRGQASVNASYNNKVAVQEFSEEVYYQVINQKTAALFEACAAIGAISAGASDEDIEKASKFGQTLGIMFQIRDDIFDYYDSKEIGKPTGNDMAEGKLTLPVIYALNNTYFESMHTLARKVKAGTINLDEIAVLVEFTKQNGGIEYAERKMQEFSGLCKKYIEENVKEKAVKEALAAYVAYVVQRNY